MFEIGLYVNNIDFNGSIEAFGSFFERYNIPIELGKTAMALLPYAAKQKLLIMLANRSKGAIINALQNSVDKNNIAIKFNDIQINGGTNTVEIKININDVDYESIAKFALPIVLEKLSDNKNLSFLNELSANPQVAENVVSAVLNTLPDEMKNHMVSSALKCYNDKIANALNNILADKKIKAHVSLIDVELI